MMCVLRTKRHSESLSSWNQSRIWAKHAETKAAKNHHVFPYLDVSKNVYVLFTQRFCWRWTASSRQTRRSFLITDAKQLSFESDMTTRLQELKSSSIFIQGGAFETRWCIWNKVKWWKRRGSQKMKGKQKGEKLWSWTIVSNDSSVLRRADLISQDSSSWLSDRNSDSDWSTSTRVLNQIVLHSSQWSDSNLFLRHALHYVSTGTRTPVNVTSLELDLQCHNLRTASKVRDWSTRTMLKLMIEALKQWSIW